MTDDRTGILINEIDSDTPGVDTMEFVELYDGGKGIPFSTDWFSCSITGLMT